MPKEHQLWLVDAKVEEWLQVVKGIRAARGALGLEGGMQEAKGFFDLYTGGGPVLIGADDDREKIAEAGRLLEERSSGAATPAVNPDPADLEALRVAGVAEGAWPPHEGEEGPQEAQDAAVDPSQVFERRLFDTAMVLMAQTGGSPVKAFMFAKQLHAVTDHDLFDLTADAMATTFGIAFEANDGGEDEHA